MAIADEINKLREEFDGCNLVAFADLSSKMVLLTSSPKKIPQENLDHLCAEAAMMLKGAAANLNTDAAPLTALVTDGDKTHIYMRNQADTDDVLCCICGPDIDLTSFMASAQARLEQIMPGGEG